MRLLVGIGVAADVDEEGRVVHRGPAVLVEVELLRDPQGDATLAQHMLHRLPEAESDAERQRGEHLRQADRLRVLDAHDGRHYVRSAAKDPVNTRWSGAGGRDIVAVVRTVAPRRGGTHMPKVSKDTTEKVVDFPVAEDRSSDLDDYTVNFVTIRETHSMAPMLASLPDGHCACPHWGYVFAGRMVVHYADHDETIAGRGRLLLVPGTRSRDRCRHGVRPVQPGRGAEGDRRRDHGGAAGRLMRCPSH